MERTPEELKEISLELIRQHNENLLVFAGMRRKYLEMAKAVPLCRVRAVGNEETGNTPNNMLSVNFYFWIVDKIIKGELDISKI